MQLMNALKILQVLDLMGKMPMVGEGTTRPTIEHYSGVSHSSVYRYMGRLLGLGLVSVTLIENRNNIMVSYYKITEKGKGYVLQDEDLLI